MPPQVCVLTPSCEATKIISGDELLSAVKLLRKFAGRLYPASMTACASVTAPA